MSTQQNLQPIIDPHFLHPCSVRVDSPHPSHIMSQHDSPLPSVSTMHLPSQHSGLPHRTLESPNPHHTLHGLPPLCYRGQVYQAGSHHPPPSVHQSSQQYMHYQPHCSVVQNPGIQAPHTPLHYSTTNPPEYQHTAQPDHPMIFPYHDQQQSPAKGIHLHTDHPKQYHSGHHSVTTQNPRVMDFSNTLPPATTEYSRYLRACYTSTELPTDNKWPPTPSEHYINLACISKKGISRREADRFTKAAIRYEDIGNTGIDLIMHEKRPMDFTEVACKLPDGSLPKLVLIEGAPGVGKTTFAWEFCRRWGNGEILQHCSLVLLLRLRDKRVREAKILVDLFYYDKAVESGVTREILMSQHSILSRRT